MKGNRPSHTHLMMQISQHFSTGKATLDVDWKQMIETDLRSRSHILLLRYAFDDRLDVLKVCTSIDL